MEFVLPPRWELPPADAVALQRELAARVVLEDGLSRLELAAGVDLAAGRWGETGRAAAVVWRVAEGAVVEEQVVEAPLLVPYVPGLLAFREGPLVEAVLRRLRAEPDVLLVDGHGIAHPRGLGIAAHLGVLLERPVIGVGKSRLYGAAPTPGPLPGDREPLRAPDGRVLGTVLRTRAGCRPLYVSPGNRITVETATAVVERCLRGHRLPEPLFLADRLSKDRRAPVPASES